MNNNIDLFGLLPSNYSGPNIEKLMAMISKEISKSRHIAEELLIQGSVLESTWALELWERELGIVRHESMTQQQRRQRVYSYINTLYPSSKKQVVNALKVWGHDGEVIEHFDTFFVELILKVKGVLAFPLDEILKEMENIIPAHLEYLFYINYNYEVGISSHTVGYVYEHDLTGTKPDRSTLGSTKDIESVSEFNFGKYEFKPIETNTIKSGLFPGVGTLGVSGVVDLISEIMFKVYDFKPVKTDTEKTGNYPNIEMLGLTSEIEAATIANVKSRLFKSQETGVFPDTKIMGSVYDEESSTISDVTMYSVEYNLCGTGYSGGGEQ